MFSNADLRHLLRAIQSSPTTRGERVVLDVSGGKEIVSKLSDEREQSVHQRREVFAPEILGAGIWPPGHLVFHPYRIFVSLALWMFPIWPAACVRSKAGSQVLRGVLALERCF